MDENLIPESNQSQPSREISLKEQFTTVTTLSKYLALALFIALPFIGFWLGLQFQKVDSAESVGKYESPVVASPQNKPSESLVTVVGEKEVDATSTGITELKTYRNEEHSFEFKYPPSLTEIGGDGLVNLGFCPVEGEMCQEAFSISFLNATSIGAWYESITKGGYYNYSLSAPNFEDTNINGLLARKILDPRDSFYRGGAPCYVTAIYSKKGLFEICDNLHNETTKSLIDSFTIN